MATDFDAVIIGSGFGGAVAALRLAEGGYRVVVLERGRRWKREEYPSVSRSNWIWDEEHPAQNNGWLDFRFLDNIGTVTGAGVGGGSLHFANVVIDAQEDLFQTGLWPPQITFQEMKRYYQRVFDVLTPRTIPANQHSNRTKLLKRAAKEAGFLAQYSELDLAVKFKEEYAYDASRVPRAEDSVMTPNADGIDQGFCVHLGQCDLGCPVEARNTLALNYIPRAEKNGAEVRPLHIVRIIEPLNDGYRIHFDRIEGGTLKRGSLTARLVVVAAGSLGSSELLLRCQKQHKSLPKFGKALGSKWCSNANYLSPAFHTGDPVYPSRGPTITAGIRFFGNNEYKGSRFMIEDGGVPDLLKQNPEALRNLSGNARRFRVPLEALYQGINKQSFDALMPWFAQGRDQPIGKFKVERWFLGLIGNYVFRLSWDPKGARKVLDTIQEIHRTLAEKTEGRIPFQPPNALITPHPLGGCPMASDAENGVVNHLGETFAYRNLYVADGAILPGPVGHNPSKTIAALSERISEHIVAEER